LEPSTLEDYLYGGWIFGPLIPELSTEWLEIVARERPTPSVQFFLGTQRMLLLAKTYDPEQIDLALATLLSAKTQLRDNGKSAWVLSLTHLMAADINRIQGNQVGSRFHYDKAKEEARRMMETYEEFAYPHMLSMSIAIYEDRLEDALLHLQSAAPRPGFFPMALFFTPLLFHYLGRYEEALAGLKGMPAPFRTEWVWCMVHTFLLAEVHGIDEAETYFREWKEQYGNIPRSSGHDLDYAIQSFFGRPREAVQSSREYLQNASLSRYYIQDPFNIALDRYICDEITAEDFYKMATKRFDRMHADFLIGLKHLSKGDRDAAKRRFTAVKDAGTIAFSSWFSSERWAYAFLRRLQDDPTWPPWIPVKEDAK
jgi:tetratricopeptide (TPR) repeat protein